MRKIAGAIVTAIAASVLAGPALAAPPAELITNGGFETGDFSDWNIINSGSGDIAINDGTFIPPGPGGGTCSDLR